MFTVNCQGKERNNHYEIYSRDCSTGKAYTQREKTLPASFTVGERKFLQLQPPVGFLYHTRGKKIVNRGQGSKKIDWEHCNQEKEEEEWKMLNQ